MHLGLQRDKARPEEIERYNTAKTRGAAEGWYPGNGPQENWTAIVGIAGGVTRKWSTGWETGIEFGVNSIRDYTEHTLSGKLAYRY